MHSAIELLPQRAPTDTYGSRNLRARVRDGRPDDRRDERLDARPDERLDARPDGHPDGHHNDRPDGRLDARPEGLCAAHPPPPVFNFQGGVARPPRLLYERFF